MGTSKKFNAITEQSINEKLKPARAKVKAAKDDPGQVMPNISQKTANRTASIMRKIK